MKLPLFTIAALAAAFSVHAPAAMDDAQMKAFEAECTKYASEEDVADDEVDAYIENCVRELAANPPEGEGAASESKEEAAEE